jgi:hypothetical protein
VAHLERSAEEIVKLHISSTGGPSPCVVVTGQREDLHALADALKNGERHFSGIPALNGYDSLEFRVVADITPLEKKEAKRGKFVLPAILLFMAAVAALLYLAYVGLHTLF